MLIIANTWRHLLLHPDKEYSHGTVEIFSVLNGLRSLQFPSISCPLLVEQTQSVSKFSTRTLDEAQVEAGAGSEGREER